jgi:hypothetical protein
MTVDRQESFTPLAFDFLWEAFGIGELPYPLIVRSHGETEDQRMFARRTAQAEFERRFRDPSGQFDPFVRSSIALLGNSVLSIDALHIPEFRRPPVGILAASNGGEAVIAIQNKDGIALRGVQPESLVSTVVDLLPHERRGEEASITLPLEEAARTAPDQGVEVPEESGKSGLLGRTKVAKPVKSKSRISLSDRVADPRHSYARLVGQPRLRGGQLAVNSRSALGGRRRSSVLAWFDTVTGRYLSLSRTGTDGRVWMTVSPADSMTLRTRLGEMVQIVSHE